MMMQLADARLLKALLLVALVCGTLAVATAQDTAERDLARVRLGLEDEPWLRINAGGHSATLQALAFTPDSSRLCSAGLDKNVQVWNLTAVRRDLRRIFLRERTIRWQVARGLRGSIFALATAPNDGLLAIGGYGAMGMLGEILLVDPVQGTLKQTLEHHRQTVCSLVFSADGNWLASTDTSGATTLWKRGQWQPVVLYDPDDKTYDRRTAARIAKQPKLRPIVFLGSSHVVLPGFVGKPSDPRLQWKLLQIDVNNRKDFKAFETVHYGAVTALAATPDGSRLASADLEGNLYVWDLRRGSSPQRLEPKAVVLSLSLSPDGRILAVGTASDPSRDASQLQLWDLEQGALVKKRPLPDHVRACRVSPDGRWLAYTGGKEHEVFIEPLERDQRPIPLQGKGRRVFKVAFAKEKFSYRVAFGTEYNGRQFNDDADLQEIFDTQKLALGSGEQLDPEDWISAQAHRGSWIAKPRDDGNLQLFRDNVPKGTVILQSLLPGLQEGHPRCYCWLPDPEGNPFAIVVGTDAQNSIYVCRLADKGPCPILRHFRGHQGSVRSVGVSHDLRYLVSGSADGTVRFWSLADYQQGKACPGRWGATFAVRGNRLVAARVHRAGPLFRKGMRDGDVVREIRWLADRMEQSEARPAMILKQLEEMSWGIPVVFKTSRNAAAQPPFQRLPAWQPLATLFVDSKAEWAFWTPEGYYDASMNGHRLFGWQINRGLRRLPDFYRADQFYRKLERPDVLERLLSAGSLHEAFRQAESKPPGQLHESLPDQIAATPRIEILSPHSGKVVHGASAEVRARVEVPASCELTDAKAFANGVAAAGQRLIEQEETAEGKRLTYQWDVPLPRDARNLIQVVVSTDAQTAAFRQVLIERGDQPPSTRPPKLFILAVGINRYGDPEIQSLNFSVADAQAVVEAMTQRSKGLYTLDSAVVLTDEKATVESWRQAVRELTEKLKAVVEPDDLVIFFFAGHGIVEEDTRKYYFVGHDMKLSDYEAGSFSRCISWDDFRSATAIPCRKVAILDTCHSGAIQPPRSRDLKAAVRQLQADVVFTLTASTGEQRSAEKDTWGHGAFTKCLLSALHGGADASEDGIVTLDEVVAYVKDSVPKLTDGAQTPTAAPDEILPFTALPLTRAD